MTSGPGGLASRHGPALDLPARFMVLAMVMLAAVAIISPLAYPLLLEGYYAPRLLAFVHLNTLGVVAAIVIGASYQLVPVVLQTSLASVRMGRLSFWFYLAGVALLLSGLVSTWRPGLVFGALLLATALLLYLLVVAWTLLIAPASDVVSWHITIALLGLTGGLAGGFLLALNKGAGFLGSMTFKLLAAHAVLMLAGWVLIMLNGVAYRLVGMFTLSEDHLWHRVAWAELVLSAAGAWVLSLGILADAPRSVLAAGSLAITGGQALFGVQLVHLYRVRLRRGFDIHIPYSLTAAAAGLAGTALLTGGVLTGTSQTSDVWVAVGWLAIGGIAITAIQGFFYKIATFLVWLHRYAPLAGRSRVPKLEDLYDRRLAIAGWVLWVTALTGSTFAVLASNRTVATLAGFAALVGLGCFLLNVMRIAAHVRPAATEQLHSAVRGHSPGIGKEGHVS